MVHKIITVQRRSVLIIIVFYLHSLIGDRSKLPRGLVVGGLDPDPNFWRSVHVSGSQGAEMQAKALEAEKEEWMSKVVVDDLSFKVSHLTLSNFIMNVRC